MCVCAYEKRIAQVSRRNRKKTKISKYQQVKIEKKKREKNWLKDIETDREKTRSIM